MVTALLVLAVLIVLNAFFAASEIALISLNDNKIKAMAEEGHKKAGLLHKLLSEPSRFLATIQIGITLAGFMASAFAAESFAGRLADALYATGIPISIEILETVSVVLITVSLSYFTLVLGELVPKRIAMEKSEAIAMFAVMPLTALSKLTAPFVKLLTLSTNVLVRLFGVDPNADKEQVTEEEIRMMVDVGKENGAIDETEKRMINNIFEFDNKSVSDIMTHRRNVVSFPLSITLREAASRIHEEKFTRFPVYDEHIDNIVGILHVKDLLPFIAEGREASTFDLQAMIRKPYFVPESKKIDELLKELQLNKVHMAVAIDEYGGTAGVVTIEDLIEEIVGNIYDEYDEDEKPIEQADDGTYIVNGGVHIREIKALLNIEIEDDEFDTLSGFIISRLGRIPEEHEQPSIDFAGFRFQVEEMNEMRLGTVKISKTAAAAYQL
ncbi:hemolysin family protein [Paenibacillus sp.]|uniref:hemolysin family protein n=1 Tax=Paenibacillus sp. TaxID=58172 RepID=UPI00281151F2|nr:hemolysin family protein [Paenibacillus sp.]